jgi:hypothetical protein
LTKEICTPNACYMADEAKATLKEYGACRAIPYAQMHSPKSAVPSVNQYSE